MREPGDASALDLMAAVAAEAIADANLEKKDIDGLLVGMPSADPGIIYPSAIGELFDLRPRMLNVLDIGGASGAGMIWRAAAAIDAGMCNAVLCLTADLDRLSRRRPPMISLMYEYEAPWRIGANCGYALIAQRHIAIYRTKPEQMAKIAVDQRHNALRNPLAYFNDTPLTIDDVLNSRYICEPLHLFEIVSPMSGGAAVIVLRPKSPGAPTSAGLAARRRRSLRPGGDNLRTEITESAIKPAAETAFKMAGVQRNDVDLVSLYDCYTITVLVSLEARAFAKRGRAARLSPSMT